MENKYNKEYEVPVSMIPQNGCIHKGMTLLDYFAAAAMPAHARHIPLGSTDPLYYEECAEMSYRTAAAMMEGRKKYLDPTNEV